MESKKLPIKLGKEPLIDAVFQLRFSSIAPASNILPGALYAQLGQGGQGISVQKLPLAHVPEAIRRADPNLQFSPVIKLEWQQYWLLIGDGSIAVSCKLPYPGWSSFRAAVAQVVKEVAKVGIVKTIDRYSLKYVDIVPASDVQRQVDGLNWQVRVGNHALKAEIAGVRVEIPRGSYRHIVSIQTGGVAEIPGRPPIEGVIVDVDSICKVSETELSKFMADMPANLDDIHTENKAMFFECLTPATLEALDPTYE